MIPKTPPPGVQEPSRTSRRSAPRIGDEWLWIAYGLLLVAFVALAPHL